MGETADSNKARIIEATKRIMAQKGVNNTTLREIAKEAGISNGSLYYCFKSKDLILYEIMDESASEAQKTAEKIHKKELGKEEIEHIILSKVPERIANVEENNLFFYLAQEALIGNQELKQKLVEKYQAWIDSTEDVISSYLEIEKSRLTKALSHVIIAAIDGLSLQKSMGLDLGEETGLGELGDLLMHGGIAFEKK